MDSFSRLTQPDALRVCRQDGANLAITYGVNGNFFIMEEYKSGIKSGSAWIDGNDWVQDIWSFRDGKQSNR
jgi:hypothetical protein